MSETSAETTLVTNIPNPPAQSPVDNVAWWKRLPEASTADVAPDSILWSEMMPGGTHWSWRIQRGRALRFVAMDSDVNLSMVLYAAHDKLERYNMPDSLKAQHTAHYSTGHVLMSDMGRAMASITHDTLGWHDPLGLLLDNKRMQARYGEKRYQAHRNGMYRSGKDGLLTEIGKHGLSARDLVIGVNWFSKVSVDEQGGFVYHPGHCQPGHWFELRCDMDVVVAVSSAPHPLDTRSVYQPGRIGILARHVGAAAPDDVCRRLRPENARALHNTDMFHA
jgi:urea carboxylase-associated protein 2